MTAAPLATPAPAKSWLWPNAIYALIAMNLIVVGITIYAANRDPSFAVEPDYDTKALEWNKTAAQIATNQRLGWTLSVESWPARGNPKLTVRLADSIGRPLGGARVELTAFSSLRSGERRSSTLTAAEPGLYAGELPIDRAGLWEFRFTVHRGPETFTRTLEQEIAG